MSDNNLYQFSQEEGYESVINSDNSQLKYLGFDRIFLKAGNSLEREITGEEIVIVLQSGDFTATVECQDGSGFDHINGVRSNVFAGLPTAIYLPPQSKIKLKTEQGMEALVYSAPCQQGGSAHFIEPKDITEKTSGALNWRRKVRLIYGPESSVTQKLIVGESISNPGGWIGFPAHKHDTKSESEYPLEEIFSFKLHGAHGAFAYHHSYDYEAGWDESYLIDSNDLAVAIPKGYHTSQAVPGCRYYLLWGLAGKKKVYKLTFDPRFQWLSDAETLFEDSVGKNLTDVMVGKAE
ncbi:5-deoxy-glucuronate isomerase [Natroniella acetigena]|uniref:5-deoxy-glucuronate isomerase n=1 Tax=Natroniella acetigena TaxID=52004 RepID=UPI00200B7126|nr:5-deoxy-glucuronate isomerase [Natroniella acetigena]MCK8827420.1 5-deoxy-glucuronate isomerase [Natroniella acetigena]